MEKLYIKDGRVLPAKRIVIKADGFQTINPTEEMILANGWQEYVAPVVEETETPTTEEMLAAFLREEVNRRYDMDNETVKRYRPFIYSWEQYTDIRYGQIVEHDGKLWRALRDMPVQYPPTTEQEEWEEVV